MNMRYWTRYETMKKKKYIQQNIFPTKDEFLDNLKQMKSEEDRKDFLINFYQNYCGAEDMWEVMSDATLEGLNEDEMNYVEGEDPETLWLYMFKDYIYWYIGKLKEKVPMKIAKKYLTKQELKNLKYLEDQELLNSL